MTPAFSIEFFDRRPTQCAIGAADVYPLWRDGLSLIGLPGSSCFGPIARLRPRIVPVPVAAAISVVIDWRIEVAALTVMAFAVPSLHEARAVGLIVEAFPLEIATARVAVVSNIGNSPTFHMLAGGADNVRFTLPCMCWRHSGQRQAADSEQGRANAFYGKRFSQGTSPEDADRI